MVLWLWRRWAAAAPVQPLVWELPYAAGTALKREREREREREKGGKEGRKEGREGGREG